MAEPAHELTPIPPADAIEVDSILSFHPDLIVKAGHNFVQRIADSERVVSRLEIGSEDHTAALEELKWNVATLAAAGITHAAKTRFLAENPNAQPTYREVTLFDNKMFAHRPSTAIEGEAIDVQDHTAVLPAVRRGDPDPEAARTKLSAIQSGSSKAQQVLGTDNVYNQVSDTTEELVGTSQVTNLAAVYREVARLYRQADGYHYLGDQTTNNPALRAQYYDLALSTREAATRIVNAGTFKVHNFSGFDKAIGVEGNS